ncbi:hypothetical protein Godav_023076 [Gossypium davidsonii]|uniref:RNase H type-1 domain-containing protein n=1 Tax=Gossypium davidsonii TaxID=34287 RepID=A0A7J8SR79_GOSDV|nr:hypothetical protein [Gossypium davidsonii]
MKENIDRIQKRCILSHHSYRNLKRLFVQILFEVGGARVRRKKKLGMRMIINNHVPTSFAAEAIRCLQGIQMGLDLGFRKVVVEEDSINVIKKLQNQKEDMSMIRDYIEDARIESRDFEECMFRYVGRNANETAN